MSNSKAQKLPRVVKKQIKKANPAGFPSEPLQTATKPVTERKPRLKPLVVDPPEPPAKVPTERILANIAGHYKQYFTENYKRLEDPKEDPKALAAEVVNSWFIRVLSKHKGFEPQKLMELVITDYVRAERPESLKPKVEDEPAKKPRHTQRQVIQSETTPPPIHTKPHPKQRTAKSVPRQKRFDESKIVRDALHALLESNPVLKAVFCEATLVEAKHLLRTNRQTTQLADRLKVELASTRVYNYLDTAIRTLVPKYNKEQQEAEQAAQTAAEQRRKERVEAARAKKQVHQETKRHEEAILEPGYWKARNKAELST
jgi:hypothetical protein